MSNLHTAPTVPNLISARECFLHFTLPSVLDTFSVPLEPFAPGMLAAPMRAVPSSLDEVRETLIGWGPEFSVFSRVTDLVVCQIVGRWIAVSDALTEAEVRAATVAYWDPFGDKRVRLEAEGFSMVLPMMEEPDFFGIVRAYLEHSYDVPVALCVSAMAANRTGLRKQYIAGAMPSDAVRYLLDAIRRQAGVHAFLV